MIKLIDLNYYCHSEISEPAKALELQKAATGYIAFARQQLKIELVKHINFEGVKYLYGVKCSFFRSRNKSWYVPFKTHRYIRKQQPDIVLIQGLIFPLQLIALKIQLGWRVKIMVQHHGEHPAKGLKKWLQKMADRYIQMYLFTSAENANEWIVAKIISDGEKCYEILEASTWFQKMDKKYHLERLQLTGTPKFLWVGRLNANKDPLTVIAAFERFVADQPGAKLYMIFQTEELLLEIKKKIASSPQLSETIILTGKVQHRELKEWFNAADFYISASHSEASSYALIEAVACGCVPIVTSIPPFRKITNEGKFGFLFEAGDPESLLHVLSKVKYINTEQLSISIVEHFKKSLSFRSIADRLNSLSKLLISEKSHD